jgi:hypothetical protein
MERLGLGPQDFWQRNGSWTVRRQHNIVDGAAPFYGVYETGGSVLTRSGTTQPAPAPRFSGFDPPDPAPPPRPGEHTREILTGWGVPEPEALIESGAAVQLPFGGS